MKDLTEMSDKELIDFKKRIQKQINDNQLNNNQRYSNYTASYGDNMNDDYNGDGYEYYELNCIIGEIHKELERIYH